jgi:hypothetical protein
VSRHAQPRYTKDLDILICPRRKVPHGCHRKTNL